MAYFHAPKTDTATHVQVSQRNQHTGVATQAWTSTRCHRLLRPLQSRITALRRNVFANATKTVSVASTHLTSLLSNHVTKRPSRSHDHGVERQKKRPRHTYSQKRSFKCSSTIKTACTPPRGARQLSRLTSHVQDSRNLGLPGLATPVLRRARDPDAQYHDAERSGIYGHQTSKEPSHTSARVQQAPDCPVQRLEALRHQIPLSRWRVYDAILHDMDTLLRSTAIRHGMPSPKSLLSMCLRKIPEYVREIEEWERYQSDEHGITSAAEWSSPSIRVYDSLEALGCAGNGWKHLRALVRAHAISILKGAISEGLLDTAFTEILAQLCSNLGYAAGATELVEALVDRPYPGPRGTRSTLAEDNRLKPLAILFDISGRANNTSCLFKSISALFSDARLPEAWLCTKPFAHIWTSAAYALLEDQVGIFASQFISDTIGLLCIAPSSQNEKAPNRGMVGSSSRSSELTLVNVVGGMTAMAIVSRNRCDMGVDVRNEGRRAQMSRRVLYILQRAMTASPSTSGTPNSSAFIVVLAVYILGCEQNIPSVMEDSKSFLQAAWASHKKDQSGTAHGKLHEVTVALVCSIAQSSGHASLEQSSYYFPRLCDLLDRLDLPGMQGVRRDGAFLLAQKTRDLRDLLFAENLTHRTTERRTHHRSDEPAEALFAGYRWEEGISEWIVVSPAMIRGKRRYPEEQLGRNKAIKIWEERPNLTKAGSLSRYRGKNNAKTEDRRTTQNVLQSQVNGRLALGNVHSQLGDLLGKIPQVENHEQASRNGDEFPDPQQEYQLKFPSGRRRSVRARHQGVGRDGKVRVRVRVALGDRGTPNTDIQSDDELGI